MAIILHFASVCNSVIPLLIFFVPFGSTPLLIIISLYHKKSFCQAVIINKVCGVLKSRHALHLCHTYRWANAERHIRTSVIVLTLPSTVFQFYRKKQNIQYTAKIPIKIPLIVLPFHPPPNCSVLSLYHNFRKSQAVLRFYIIISLCHLTAD